MKSSPIMLACSLLLACSTTPIELTAPNLSAAMTLPLSEFPGARTLIDGFDHRRGDTRWANGDRVLFGLRLKKGESVHRWLLQLEVIVGDRVIDLIKDGDNDLGIFEERQWSYTAEINGKRRQIPIKSSTSLVEVKVHDEAGMLLGKSLVKLPSQLMSRGLLPGIECALDHQQAGGDFTSFTSADAVRPMAEGLISLIALLHIVQHDDVLEDYFWQVIQKPSVWSVITGLGVSASLTASLEKSVRITELPAHLPPTQRAYAMPLRVDVNDTPALLADVIAVDAKRPYGLCSGIVAAYARHPTDDIRFDVQLLAARIRDK